MTAYPEVIAFSSQHRVQDVPVAMDLIFGAMAHQRDVAAFAECLQQPKSEFLTMVLNRSITRVY